jgi:signal transduction histidine kinase
LRLAGFGVAAGVALVAAFFYAQVNARFAGATVARTLGPYSDALAEYGFSSSDPDIWQRMAAKHDVAILVEPPAGEPVAFDAHGGILSPSALGGGPLRAVRTLPDGTRVTLSWSPGALYSSHWPSMAGLLAMVSAVVGCAFWFLQRQLKPLAGLHAGVEAVARGEFDARVPVVRDDEIGQVAGAFNEMAQRVGAMIDDRERLLADVSHELRSPIGRMKVALELLPEGGKRDALDRDLREMEKLIGVLLEREALRLRAGRIESKKVDLGALVREVAAGFVDRGHPVEVDSGNVTIHADPALMTLLIRNLLDNAVKFSLPDSRAVAVTFEADEGGAVLTVADDGIGIPEGSEEMVFEPFVKLDRARGHRVGYGIGLNLCRRIVRLHGGEIRLLPRRPRGTEAVVTLRRARVAEAESG